MFPRTHWWQVPPLFWWAVRIESGDKDIVLIAFQAVKQALALLHPGILPTVFRYNEVIVRVRFDGVAQMFTAACQFGLLLFVAVP